jgi:carbon-monoxide dehydrogenase medium subunit
MKLRPFGKRRATVQVPVRFDRELAPLVKEDISLLERHGPEARLLAGEHGLVSTMKSRPAFPETLINVHDLAAGLRYMREKDGALEIGALAGHQDVLGSEKDYDLALAHWRSIA